MKILHKELYSEEENLSLSSLGEESSVSKHLLSWTGSSSMTLIEMKLRPRHNVKITLNLLRLFILFYFLQFINYVSCSI